MRRNRIVDASLLILAIALLSVLVSLRSSMERASVTVPSTYDTGARGFAALYALLARERVPVGRFEETISNLGERHGTFIIAGDYQMLAVAATAPRRRQLDNWVRRGGTLGLFGVVPFWMRSDFGVPRGVRIHAGTARAACGLAARGLVVAGLFTNGYDAACRRDYVALLATADRATVIAYRRGKGTVLFSSTTTFLDNEHLAALDNARFAYALFSRGPVIFEEHGYGHTRAQSFWQVLPLPMHVAIVLAIAAVLLAILGANLSFAPAHPAQTADQRDSGEYIASLARMLTRGGAQRAIVQRFCSAVENALGPRAHSDDHARELLQRARTLQSLPGPGTEDVIEAGRLFVRVQKDYTW